MCQGREHGRVFVAIQIWLVHLARRVGSTRQMGQIMADHGDSNVAHINAAVKKEGKERVSAARLHAQKPGDGGQVLLLQHGGRVASHGAALCQLHGCWHNPAAADAAQRTHAVQRIVAACHHASQVACSIRCSHLKHIPSGHSSQWHHTKCDVYELPGMQDSEHPISGSILQTRDRYEGRCEAVFCGGDNVTKSTPARDSRRWPPGKEWR